MASSPQLLSPHDIPQRPSFTRTISQRSATSQTSTTSAISNKSSTTSRLHASLFPEKDKPRLYIALLPRGGSSPTCTSQLTCDNYHWVLMIGPKTATRSEAGIMYHLVHAPNDSSGQALRYEEIDLSDDPHASSKLLVRIALAKVLDEQRVEQLLRGMKIPQSPTVSARPSNHFSAPSPSASSGSDEDDDDDHDHSDSCSSYTCLTFVREAFNLLTDPSVSKKSNRPLKSYFSGDDWKDIEWRTRKYVKRKNAQGRFRRNGTRNYLLGGAATWSANEVATWNFWENRETTD